MTFADVKTLAEIIALALGGAWAIFAFVILRQREKAAAELRKMDIEAKKTELELRRVAVIRADISASTTQLRQTDGYLLLAEVTLINEGKRDTRLKWGGEPPAFVIWRAVFDATGIPSFPDTPIQLTVRKAKDPNADAISRIVRAGGSEHLSFAAHLSLPGVYLLSFRAAVAPDEKSVSVEAGAGPNSVLGWTATKYIIVEHERTDAGH